MTIPTINDYAGALIPISLRDTLTGLDDRGIQLMITAVLHASGRPASQTHP
jgi:hypothetical protein